MTPEPSRFGDDANFKQNLMVLAAREKVRVAQTPGSKYFIHPGSLQALAARSVAGIAGRASYHTDKGKFVFLWGPHTTGLLTNSEDGAAASELGEILDAAFKIGDLTALSAIFKPAEFDMISQMSPAQKGTRAKRIWNSFTKDERALAHLKMQAQVSRISRSLGVGGAAIRAGHGVGSSEAQVDSLRTSTANKFAHSSGVFKTHASKKAAANGDFFKSHPAVTKDGGFLGDDVAAINEAGSGLDRRSKWACLGQKGWKKMAKSNPEHADQFNKLAEIAHETGAHGVLQKVKDKSTGQIQWQCITFSGDGNLSSKRYQLWLKASQPSTGLKKLASQHLNRELYQAAAQGTDRTGGSALRQDTKPASVEAKKERIRKLGFTNPQEIDAMAKFIDHEFIVAFTYAKQNPDVQGISFAQGADAAITAAAAAASTYLRNLTGTAKFNPQDAKQVLSSTAVAEAMELDLATATGGGFASSGTFGSAGAAGFGNPGGGGILMGNDFDEYASEVSDNEGDAEPD